MIPKFARYRYETVPISERSAKRQRRDEIVHREAQISELTKELATLKRRPLPKTRKNQIAVYPGQPGYDKLPATFDPVDWQGAVVWKNIPSK